MDDGSEPLCRRALLAGNEMKAPMRCVLVPGDEGGAARAASAMLERSIAGRPWSAEFLASTVVFEQLIPRGRVGSHHGFIAILPIPILYGLVILIYQM